MRKPALILAAAWVGVALAQNPATAPPPQPGAAAPQPVRPIGVVTQIKTGSLTLQTDAGPILEVPLPEGISVVRVPPGAKDLKTAAPITVGEISLGDRVLIRGRVSDDQKYVTATAVIVMAKTELDKTRESERAEWRRRGIGGRVKSLDATAKEITIAVPTRPPDPANPTHPVTITLAANAVLLRYAQDSVKFSDARPGTLDEIKTGDQVRALGTKSEDGARFTAEKLVSGTFRNIGATVISADAQNATVSVKDLASGKPVVVRVNSDSKMHRLPPFVAQMLAGFSSGAGHGGGAHGAEAQGGGEGGGPAAAGGRNGGPPDFQEMLDRAPALSVGELKPGDALMVLSTEGAKSSEVTAIIVLAGVEPILAAQPKGSEQMVLGQWNMGGGGGEGGP